MARKYDQKYKEQAAKLAQEIEGAKVTKELGITKETRKCPRECYIIKEWKIK